MVVVSGSWVKNVVSFPTNGDLITPKMAARAVLICRPNSHPFQERSLLLDQPVKIGRSVARARAVPNNAIFDCKVLSRNHALLWYEKGKFYLQDTKSSNGTFVNNQRLSKGAEESPPREVCSGDIVQFGVDVMENARKVTHGCIVATLKLYLPDGKEAKASPSTSVVSSVGAVSLEDLYQLNQYLQEALQREQMLENKLVTLQHLVESTRQASELGWKALIDEDRLLSRVEILESQLQVSSKNFGEDKLREELRKLQEDKCQYQGTAKESLAKVLQEKLDAVQKLQALESNVANAEDECAHLKRLCERGQQDLQELAHKYSAQLQKVEELQAKLQDSDEQGRETSDRLQQEKRDLQGRIDAELEVEQLLQLRLDALELERDLAEQKVAALQAHRNSLIEKNDDNEGDTKMAANEQLDNMKLSTDSTETQVGLILERIDTTTTGAPPMDNNATEETEGLRHLIKKYEEELVECRAKVTHLEAQMELIELLSSCEVDQASKLQVQLESLRTEDDTISETNAILQEKLAEVLSELTHINQSNENKRINEPAATQNNATQVSMTQNNPVPSTNQVNKLKLELSQCQELLVESRAKKSESEVRRSLYQMDLDCANAKLRQTNEEVGVVRLQLQMAQHQMNAKNETVEELRRLLVTSALEVRLQLAAMNERLKEEWERGNKNGMEAQHHRKEVVFMQQEAKQCRNQIEKMHDRMKAMHAELEEARRLLSVQGDDNRKLEEMALLQERCAALDHENARLRSTSDRLEQQSRELNEQAETLRRLRERNVAMEACLATSHPATSHPAARTAVAIAAPAASAAVDAAPAQEDLPAGLVTALEEELVVVKQEFTRCNEDKTQLANELKLLREELGSLASTSYAVPVHYLIPMALALMAILVTYWFLV